MSEHAYEPSVFAKNLRQAMRDRYITFAALAAKSGIHQASLVRLTSGETARPRRNTVERIANALGVPPDALLREGGLDSIKTVFIPEPVQESLFAPPAKPKAPEGTVPLVPGMLYVDGYVKDLFIPTRAVPIPTVLASLPPERRENLFAVRSDRSYDCGIRQGDLLFILRGETAPGALLLVQGNDYTAEVIRSDALRRIDHECCGLIAALERSLL